LGTTVIRFIPDTWWEALLRPFAMAAPNGNVYVEIIAADLRFAMALILAAVLLALRRRIAEHGRGVWVLFAFVALSFAPWLATSGNGRYFVAVLLAVGPLCVGLVWLLPISRGSRAVCALGVLALQTAVVFDTPPWRSWNHALWRNAPYFALDVPADVAAQPATFVTITSISYSLLFPQFHPASHWINLTGLSPNASVSSEAARASKLFAKTPLYVFVPTVPSHTQPDGRPDLEIISTIDRHLAPHRMRITAAQGCRMLPSSTVAQMVLQYPERASQQQLNKLGFWLCPLSYPVPYLPQMQAATPRIEAVFTQVEKSCPRLFPPGTSSTSLLPHGAMRDYASADMKLYVLEDGRVLYKYWRALNPEVIGTVDEVLAPAFRMDCLNIRGRSGLPWQRSL
jgi:hypothetical protein